MNKHQTLLTDKLMEAAEQYLLTFIGVVMSKPIDPGALDMRRRALLDQLNAIQDDLEKIEVEPTQNGYPRSDPRSGIWDSATKDKSDAGE